MGKMFKSSQSLQVDKENKNKSLSPREALKLCQKLSYPLTWPGLKYIGLRNDFAYKKGNSWIIDREGLENYIANAKIKPGKDYLSIRETMAVTKKSISRIYQWIYAGLLEIDKFGPGEGVIYVRKESIKKVDPEYRRND